MSYYCWHHPWGEWVGRRNHKPLSFYVSGWNFLLHIFVVSVSSHKRLNDGWVCGLAKRLRYESLPENMMNCNYKVDWEHSLFVFKKVYALYFDVVRNYYLLIRSFMIKFIAVIIISMMLLCPYFVFIDTSLSKHVDMIFISAFAWGQASSKLCCVDTSILHRVFLLSFIVFLFIITLCGVILMPFLS